MYNRTKWLDHVKDVDTGEVIQQGTDLSARNFNNLEGGVSDANLAAAIMAIALGNINAGLTVEEITVTLTNTASYPFNNSKKTVSLTNTRSTTNYTVESEVVEHDGDVGNIIISDKLTNGFKVAYDGSARSATVMLKIKGGM